MFLDQIPFSPDFSLVFFFFSNPLPSLSEFCVHMLIFLLGHFQISHWLIAIYKFLIWTHYYL